MMDYKRQAAAPGHKERTGPYSAADTYETGASGAWQTVVLSDMKTTTNFPCYGFIIILVYNNINIFFPPTIQKIQYRKRVLCNLVTHHLRFQFLLRTRKIIPVRRNNPTCSRHNFSPGLYFERRSFSRLSNNKLNDLVGSSSSDTHCAYDVMQWWNVTT